MTDMTEREIKRIVQEVLTNGKTVDEQATELADRWHEAVAIAHKESWSAGHTQGYNDGTREARGEAQSES